MYPNQSCAGLKRDPYRYRSGTVKLLIVSSRRKSPDATIVLLYRNYWLKIAYVVNYWMPQLYIHI
jgi:hypothetical protein